MQPLSSSPGPQTDSVPAERQFTSPPHAMTYAAFCHDHWPVYRRYASAVTGSAATGESLARAALHELGIQWPTALRSAVPSALAWALLCATTASHRTVTLRTLQRSLHPREADALILRYRLGLTTRQAGHAMGMAPAAFDLLRRNALRKAAELDRETHMPGSNALNPGKVCAGALQAVSVSEQLPRVSPGSGSG